MKTCKLSGIALSGALACAGCSSGSATGSSGSNGSNGSGAGTVQVTFSGETLGVDGLPFTPSTSADADPWFVDGWSMTYSEILL